VWADAIIGFGGVAQGEAVDADALASTLADVEVG
jgi:hypothetical protein